MDEAGKTYEKAAETYAQGKATHEAASSYVDAANCYVKTSTADAIRCRESAVEIFATEGKFSMAAKLHKTIAEMCEKENDVDNAMHHYERAADLYDGENSATTARGCRLKVAKFAAEKGDYTKAIEILEQAANDAVDTRGGQYACKEYFLQAGLCYLVNDDTVGLRQAIAKYKDIVITFERDRECKFLEEILEACENYDVEQFTNVVSEYNSLTPLDTWKVGLLAKVKEHLKASNGDEEGGDNNEGII